MPARHQPTAKRVLVYLDALFPGEDDVPHYQPSGLLLAGWAEGILHRWILSSTGRWIGVITVYVRTAPPAYSKREGERNAAKDQLVPAEALRLAPPR